MPPWRRVVDMSACSNGANSRSTSSGAMPTPVSRTAKWAPHVSADSRATATSTLTSPRSVNLMPLPIRLSSTWRRRSASPTTHSGAPGLDAVDQLEALLVRLDRQRAAWHRRRPRPGRTRPASSCSLPASSFETSRMSLITPSSPSALERSVARYSRCSGVSDVSASSSAIPNTPFIGVRISWLMLARNSLLARLPASAARRASARSAARARHRAAGDEGDDDGRRRAPPAPPSTAGATRARCVSTADAEARPASSWARRVSAAIAGAMRRA